MSAYALINFPKLEYKYGLIDTSNRMKSCDALAVFPPPTPQESIDENRSNIEPGGGNSVFEKEKVMKVLDTRIDSVRLVKQVLACSSSSHFRKNKRRPSSLCKQLHKSPKHQQQRRLHHSMSSNDRSKTPGAGIISWHNANPDYEDVMVFELSVPVDVQIKNETYMAQAVVFRSLSSLRELEDDLLHWITSSRQEELSKQEGANRLLSFPRLPSIHEMVDDQNFVSHLPRSTPVNWSILLDIVPLLSPSIESWLNEVVDFLFQENEHTRKENNTSTTARRRRIRRRGARSSGDNVLLAIWSNFFFPDKGSTNSYTTRQTNFSTRKQDFSSIIPCPSTLHSTEAMPLSRKRSSHLASIPEQCDSL